MNRRGRPPYPDVLTPRQQEVLDLVREGLTNEQIAGRLGISHDGAKFHVSEILSRLGVTSRTEAARWQREQTAERPSASLAHRRHGTTRRSIRLGQRGSPIGAWAIPARRRGLKARAMGVGRGGAHRHVVRRRAGAYVWLATGARAA
jgi:DNA-binding CsgD family transcriptional regulator